VRCTPQWRISKEPLLTQLLRRRAVLCWCAVGGRDQSPEGVGVALFQRPSHPWRSKLNPPPVRAGRHSDLRRSESTEGAVVEQNPSAIASDSHVGDVLPKGATAAPGAAGSVGSV